MKIFDKKTENEKEIKIKEYMNNYIFELQRHFDLSDRKMRIILHKIYKEKSPLNVIKNWFSMVKSCYQEKLKETKWK